MKFLDTNIILRFLTRDDERKAQACLLLFQRVERGEEKVTLGEAILTEVCYILLLLDIPTSLVARKSALVCFLYLVFAACACVTSGCICGP